MIIQNHINEIQSIYKEWLAVQKRLETAKRDLTKSIELMSKLECFYFDGEYREFSEQIENGAKVDLTTDGEYSVMGEDTIWNAFHEQQVLLWDFLRTATKALDRDAPEFYAQASNTPQKD
ncbi:DUF4298 domain-containing protein [Moraxella sp. Tifton1]|uniref:DUF4298 domain-containing protein n=1 Tax=Moraxella oculi TaxID=2940516 RepID=A0ABW8U7X6_9GAMM|nr:DUF4298 domain-containing protein [Moraxella sp. Tifton1]MCL1623531.1 DUF4298 domain-containing protein [Moraxella sp. Tifton1]